MRRNHSISGARTAWHIVWLYAFVHAIVDLATVTSIVRASRRADTFDTDFLTPFAIIVGYDVLAFALQAPLGALVDRWNLARPTLIASLALVLSSVLAIPLSRTGTMALAGVGNALFHVSAGAIVLAMSCGRSAPAGVFVGPGACGLAMGMFLGRQTGVVWPIALAVAAVMLAVYFVRVPKNSESVEIAEKGEKGEKGEKADGAGWVPGESATSTGAFGSASALSLLLFSVLVRSYVGFGGSYQCPKTTFVLFGLPIAAMSGKAIGGVVADRLGWVPTSVVALLLSAPMIAYSGGDTAVVVPATFLFQTTMAVTLTATYHLLPGRPALAFGLPCLALIVGGLPTFYPWGRQFYGSTTFLVLIVLSAAALWLALRPPLFPKARASARVPVSA